MYLDKTISILSSYRATECRPGRLGDFLYDPTHVDVAERIREMSDKADRDYAKSFLPCAMISTNTLTRSAGVHTGLICLDIDAGRNPCVTDWPGLVKGHLNKLDFIAFAGMSISGRGCSAIVPLAYPDQHLSQFKALEKGFKKCGITVDPACKDVTRLRGWSYNDDSTSFYNPEAKVYGGLVSIIPPKPYQTPTGSDALKVQALVDRIIAEKRDYTAGYETWIRIAQSLAVAFGESGRQWFHDVSQFNHGYDYQIADTKYTTFINRGYNQVGLGTFFRLCGGAGGPRRLTVKETGNCIPEIQAQRKGRFRPSHARPDKTSVLVPVVTI